MTLLQENLRVSRSRVVRLVLVTLIMAFSTVTAACGAATGAGEPTTTGNSGRAHTNDSELGSIEEKHKTTLSEDPDLFFPTQLQGVRDGEPRAVMQALARGRLTLDDDCLRISSGSYDGNLLIWPPDYSFRATGGNVRILDEENRVVAKTGDRIEVGGGEVPGRSLRNIAYVGKSLGQKILRRCPGPYWLVGEV